ncbi:glutathione S-transferase N-terminal domain-containing protein [Variovorax sp. N23]|uniref:glutathione S-transferase N-terminal domain-containing protein n=1 Tax=Variovorax sp. N23 TaxID=2980555 RepID=UPI0021C7F01C|nr:glutathione S-transferase N-terminal domain-containing protein [Variovorax sp. N23]MCU4118689.1 glutathione S-transferase N-terminal domain-containing protein [Variovorax sp. N23]
MPTLLSSPPSPFGRKVRIAIDVLGMADRIAVLTADTSNPDDPVRRHNPLGKIPTLLLDDGETLFDSRVIVEYLDALDGRSLLIPAAGPERIGVLREQALADGILDAALLQVYERRYRPAEHHVESWLELQRGKVSRALDAFSARLPVARPAGPSIGEITLACALGYLDFRLAGSWRATHPALVAWLDGFAQRVPAFGRTAP